MSTNQEPSLEKRIPANVFLSYASEDRKHAIWLRDQLRQAGLDNVWIDQAEIEGGENWKQEINLGLRKVSMLVALCTKFSVDPARTVIMHEWKEATRLLKTIIPLRFDHDPPKEWEDLQYINFADANTGLSKLLAVIKKTALRCTSRDKLPGGPPSMGDAFVGRDTELLELFKLIEGPTGRVEMARQNIAIQGMGGQGKTMLAEELVRRLFERYPGGFLHEIRGQAPKPADEVLQKWATLALGKAPGRVYGSADVRGLLTNYGEIIVLIDDVSESDFEEVKHLLLALPPDATRILTTRSLDIVSELGGLMYPLLRLKDHDAAELVRGRLLARMGRTSGPEDSPKQKAAISRLVELVEGHALALELASARCNFPEQLPDVVARLEASLAESVDFLAIDTNVTKDNNLWINLNISLEQLREHDRKKQGNWVRRFAMLLLQTIGIKKKPPYPATWADRFAALGVFPDSGRMNRRLIAAVWGDAGNNDPRTENALDGLYQRAMIKLEPKTLLYFSHPLLRAFARSLLRKEPAHLAAIQLRYREFLIATAAEGFRAPEQQWSPMEVYIPHLLQTATELWKECELLLGDLNALAGPEPPVATALLRPATRAEVSRAADFATAVMPYVLRRPALGENGRRILILGLACVRATGTKELLDTFVRALGVWYARREPQKAEQYFQQALRWAEDTGDRAEQGKILREYGELQRNRTNFDHAIKLLTSALVIQRDLDDPRMLAVTLKSLGEAYSRRCDFDTAMDHYKRAMEIYQRLADRSGEADLLNKIGSVEFNRGNYEGAISSFEQALPMHREVGNRSMEGEDLNDTGISWNYLHQPKRAMPLLEEAIEIHNKLGNRRLEAIAISNRAAAYYAMGAQDPAAYENAVLDARKSGAIAREIEDALTEVWSLNWEGLAQQKLHRPELALPLLVKADCMLGRAGPRERVSTWGNLGYLLGKDLGQRERGAELLEAAIKLMSDEQFTRAFGGRTRPQLESMLHEIQSPNPDTSRGTTTP